MDELDSVANTLHIVAQKRQNGVTPLEHAQSRGFSEIATILNAARNDSGRDSSWGRTAFD